MSRRKRKAAAEVTLAWDPRKRGADARAERLRWLAICDRLMQHAVLMQAVAKLRMLNGADAAADDLRLIAGDLYETVYPDTGPGATALSMDLYARKGRTPRQAGGKRRGPATEADEIENDFND